MLNWGSHKMHVLFALLCGVMFATSSVATAETCKNFRGDNWKELVKIVDAGRSLPIESQKSVYTYNVQEESGERVVIDLQLPNDGYLNIVSVAPDNSKTVLFPNKKSRENFIEAGKKTFPHDTSLYEWEAWAPCGETLIVAYLFKESLNLYEQSLKDKGLDMSEIETFAPLSDSATKSLTGKANNNITFAGGKLVINVLPE